MPFGGRGVARGEAAVVAADAGLAGEGPWRAGRAVLELARTHRHLLESRVADHARPTCGGEGPGERACHGVSGGVLHAADRGGVGG